MKDPRMDVSIPDPSWDAARLLDEAEACESLTVAWIGPLAALTADELDPDQRLQWALATNRLRAVVEALSLRALSSVPAQRCRPVSTTTCLDDETRARLCPGGRQCRHGWQDHQIAALAHESRWTLRRRVSWAHALTDLGAGLMPLLAGGRIGVEHVRAFDQILRVHTAPVVATVLDTTIDAAVHQTPENFARRVRRVLARHIDPVEAARSHEAVARECTNLHVTPLEDGMAQLSVLGPVAQIEAIRVAVESHPILAHPGAGDLRTKGQRRVDALTDMCTGGSSVGGSGPIRGGSIRGDSLRAPGEVPVGVIVTASAETLSRLSNEPGMVGDQVVDAAIVRQVVAGATWVRGAILDAHGLVTSLGRPRRFPTRRQRLLIQVRRPRCSFPGCTVPARESDLDHAREFARGGGTGLANLHPLCGTHHLLKEQPGYSLCLNPDGSVTWTFPHGRRVTVPAHDYRPVRGPYDGPPPPGPDPFDDPQRYQAWVDWSIANDPATARAA